jgi:hypothetical protein
MIYNCCSENRKAAVLADPALNGIDYLEVLDGEAVLLGSPRQRTLLVHCLNPLQPRTWTTDNAMIQGGESITNITLDWVEPALPGSPPQIIQATSEEQSYFASLPDAANVLVVRTHVAGDFSTYCLRLVNSAEQAAQDPFAVTAVLAGFDPQLAQVNFSFKVECGPDFDCEPQTPQCLLSTEPPPPINYLAKDYGTFRTIILDRLNQLLPNWGGASEADLGVALAELIAYLGDYLSYQQDAVATEAYLETARKRVSLRRHALLVDYHVHDGCNARAWIQVNVSAHNVVLPGSTTEFYTVAPGMPSSLQGTANQRVAILSGVQVFQPMQDTTLYQEQNEMRFYTWGDTDCCLPVGAIEATLRGSLTSLQPGDVLIFQEVLGPQTGNEADADIRHRCAVRLTAVTTQNAFNQPLVDPLFDVNGKALTSAAQQPMPVTEIQWAADDALPFPLCVSSSFIDSKGDTRVVPDVSLAYGNVVLADHGISLSNIKLKTVPQPRLFQPPNPAAERCTPTSPTPIPARFEPTIPDSPLTQAVPLPAASQSLSAYDLMNYDPSQAVPVIVLEGTLDGTQSKWSLPMSSSGPETDLLESGESDRVFVVEVESDGSASLRFGDNTNGMMPESGTSFVAQYRIGNGTAGNVGANSIVKFTADPTVLPYIQACTNPLPAAGGTDPETCDQIRRRAPQAFLTQERAVTPVDYQNATEMNPLVDRAAASLRWTGSWYTVFVAVEPVGAGNLTQSLKQSLETSVGAYRLAGQDLEFDSPQYVSLEINLTVCVDPNYFQLDVEQALLQVLSSGTLPNGQTGLFYPDNFTFGQTVYLSPVYAAARSVPGVVTVTATVFQPQGFPTNAYLDAGEIPLGPLQVARLDNDPNYPDHGQLTLHMEGGHSGASPYQFMGTTQTL